jgi:TRAP-type mannitol/chloroaromatic compound transport system permease large subunit
MAMAAFYLKGISPPHVKLSQIFGGCMPYVFIVIFCMAIIYAFPGVVTWLPNYLYDR